MKTPTLVLSHCLGRHPVLTPKIHLQNLTSDLALGYAGATIVPAIIPEQFTPADFVAAQKNAGSKSALVCGFLAGNGPDPHSDNWSQALESLNRPVSFAIAFAEAGLCQPVMIGPVQTHHKHRRPGWSAKEEATQDAWMRQLLAKSRSTGIKFLLEPLMFAEDAHPDAFNYVLKWCVAFPDNFGIHFDTWHAYERRVDAELYARCHRHIGHLELVNIGRSPLQVKRGIGIRSYITSMRSLRHDTTVGVEPFDQSTIEAFELQGTCDTEVPGADALAMDAVYLKEHGVMAIN